MTPGDVIGRHHACALNIADERVSEAHALLSLRGAFLHLLTLRGGMRVDGTPVRDPRLALGARIELAPQLFVPVVDLVLPDAILAVVGPGIDSVLSRSASLVLAPTPRIVPGADAQAVGRFWNDGRQWFFQHGDACDAVHSGAELSVPGWQGRIEERTLGAVSTEPTRQTERPLRIETRFATAHIYSGPVRSLTVGGVPARILHELAEFEGPVDWRLVARAVWPTGDEHKVRRRWDAALSRLRASLREAGVRDDLVHADGCGQIELLTYPGDEVDCRD